MAGMVSVANGGQVMVNGVGNHGLTVAVGGKLNVAGSLALYAPLTNSGTINLTNSAIGIYNYFPPDFLWRYSRWFR